MSGLETGMERIVASIDKLAVKFDGTQRTPWTQIWTALGVGVAFLSVIGALVWTPVKTDLERLERGIVHMQDVYSVAVVPRAEHERIWAETRRELDRLEKRIDRLEYGERRGGS